MFFRGLACSVAIWTLSVMPLAAQSFNCRLASKPDEILICQNPQLGALDQQMSSLYFRIRNRLAGAARSRLEADQVAWLQQRYGCGRDAGCIRSLYERRIAQLETY